MFLFMTFVSILRILYIYSSQIEKTFFVSSILLHRIFLSGDCSHKNEIVDCFDCDCDCCEM